MAIIELLIYTFAFLLVLITISVYAICSTTYKVKLEIIKAEYENKAKE